MRDETVLKLACIAGMFGLAALYDGNLIYTAVGVFAGMLTGGGLSRAGDRRQVRRVEKPSDPPVSP